MSISYIIQISIESMLLIISIVTWFLTKLATKGKHRHRFSYIWGIDLFAAGILASDILAIIFRGNETVAGYYIVRIANYCNFFLLYFAVFYFSIVIEILLDHPIVATKRIHATRIISSITLFLNFINMFIPYAYDFDEHNRYFRKTGWYINSGLQVIVIIILASVILQLRHDIERNIFLMLFITVITPIVSTVVQALIYGFSITCISIGLTQFVLFLIMFRYQEDSIRERELQIEEYNAKLILTQVQPHFMLNTLSAIQYLCRTDAKAAEETISDLGIYLRNNMEFATTTDLITFDKELAHIEKYVAIEKKRFGDRINVVYNIGEEGFELPALSVQPLIENAIKHGISKRREGGTIELSTWRGVDAIHVLVKDNGVGYDTSKPFSEDRVHLGLAIVGDRLKRMCGGKLVITSKPGEGTICELILPIEFNK